jgi:hypothetical protein
MHVPALQRCPGAHAAPAPQTQLAPLHPLARSGSHAVPAHEKPHVVPSHVSTPPAGGAGHGVQSLPHVSRLARLTHAAPHRC